LDHAHFLACIDTDPKVEDDHTRPVSKESIVDEHFIWHIPPQFVKDKKITHSFMSFQRELAFLLMDYLANFGDRMASRDKVSE
jgi:hypothetical protein